MGHAFSKEDIKFCPLCGAKSRFLYNDTHECETCANTFRVHRGIPVDKPPRGQSRLNRKKAREITKVETTKIAGQLEIDHERGVIYFHCNDSQIADEFGSVTILRICRLPAPVPRRAIDITHLQGVCYSAEATCQHCGAPCRYDAEISLCDKCEEKHMTGN